MMLLACASAAAGVHRLRLRRQDHDPGQRRVPQLDHPAGRRAAGPGHAPRAAHAWPPDRRRGRLRRPRDHVIGDLDAGSTPRQRRGAPGRRRLRRLRRVRPHRSTARLVTGAAGLRRDDDRPVHGDHGGRRQDAGPSGRSTSAWPPSMAACSSSSARCCSTTARATSPQWRWRCSPRPRCSSCRSGHSSCCPEQPTTASLLGGLLIFGAVIGKAVYDARPRRA